MEVTVDSPLVAEYLRQLDTAAAVLPPERRSELVAEIRDHIAQAIGAGSSPDEVAVRTLLDRLGDPEEIVAAAREGEPSLNQPPGPPTAPSWAPPQEWAFRRPSIGLEITAVVMLTLGSIIPFVGWLVGVVLLWVSRRWTVTEKILATLIVPGGPFTLLALGLLVVGQTCSSSSVSSADGASIQGPTVCTGTTLGPLGPFILVFCLVAPFIVAGVLVRRARTRSDLEPPIRYARRGNSSPWGVLEVAAVLLLSLGNFVLPVIGPIAGLICAWASVAWTTREKWIATAITCCGLLLPFGSPIAVRLG